MIIMYVHSIRNLPASKYVHIHMCILYCREVRHYHEFLKPKVVVCNALLQYVKFIANWTHLYVCTIVCAYKCMYIHISLCSCSSVCMTHHDA